MARVLLVEDDADIRGPVLRDLSSRGHDVAWVATGAEAISTVVADPPEVVVLDLGLPDVDGTTLLRMMRTTTDVPVIVATARSGTQTVVSVLDDGADDYIVKPFDVAQLDARIRAVLRRVGGDDDGPDVLVAGPLELDRTSHRASLDGVELEMKPLEFALLGYLMEHQGEVLPKRRLLAEVWRQPAGGSERTVDVHLSWLRRKLGETAAEPRFLHTVRGVGVRFEAPDT